MIATIAATTGPTRAESGNPPKRGSTVPGNLRDLRNAVTKMFDLTEAQTRQVEARCGQDVVWGPKELRNAGPTVDPARDPMAKRRAEDIDLHYTIARDQRIGDALDLVKELLRVYHGVEWR